MKFKYIANPNDNKMKTNEPINTVMYVRVYLKYEVDACAKRARFDKPDNVLPANAADTITDPMRRNTLFI